VPDPGLNQRPPYVYKVARVNSVVEIAHGNEAGANHHQFRTHAALGNPGLRTAPPTCPLVTTIPASIGSPACDPTQLVKPWTVLDGYGTTHTDTLYQQSPSTPRTFSAASLASGCLTPAETTSAPPPTTPCRCRCASLGHCAPGRSPPLLQPQCASRAYNPEDPSTSRLPGPDIQILPARAEDRPPTAFRLDYFALNYPVRAREHRLRVAWPWYAASVHVRSPVGVSGFLTVPPHTPSVIER